MFGTIRKHQTWLWVFIIAVMCIGLVQWQNSLGKSGNGGGGTANFGVIDGRPITETEMRHGQIDADLSYFLNTGGEWPEIGAPRQGWNQTVENYKQVFYARKLDQYNIHSDPDVVARFAGVVIQNITKGEGLTPQMFVERVLQPHGITAEDFRRFLDRNLSIQQLASVVGNSGKFVTPAEIQSLYVQKNQERTVDAVFFPASNYLASITQPTAAAVQQFYNNNTNGYAEPDQMQLSYVFFNITNYLSQAEKDLGTNLSAEVESAYRRAGTNAATFGKTPDEGKARIREYFIRNVAITNAYAKALAFQSEVMAKEPTSPENLNIVAKGTNLDVKVTQPFDKDYGPSEIHLSSSYPFPVASLFNLSTDEPFPDLPIKGADGVYVVAYDKSIPAHIPSLDEIHSRVVEDYREAMARSFAQGTASTFAQTVTNSLAKGKSFAAIAADTKFKPVELPPFSKSTESLPEVEDHVDLNTFKQFAFSTAVGQADFIPTRTGAVVLYVRQELPIDPVKMQANLLEFSKEVRAQRENEIFQAWFGKEANAALGKIPQVQAALRQEHS